MLGDTKKEERFWGFFWSTVIGLHLVSVKDTTV